jgi:hypothetical protein
MSANFVYKLKPLMKLAHNVIQFQADKQQQTHLKLMPPPPVLLKIYGKKQSFPLNYLG